GHPPPARTRNAQVPTALPLWLKQACADAVEALAGLVDVLVGAGRAAGPDAVVAGLTHRQPAQPALSACQPPAPAPRAPGPPPPQPAQPVLWAFQLAAHGFALTRDVGRFQDAGRRADVI